MIRCSRAFVVSWVVGFCAFIASSAHAWDSQRKGFVLGAGLGGGLTSFSQTLGTDSTERMNHAAWGGGGILGYAPSNRLVVGFVGRNALFTIDNLLGGESDIVSSTQTVAVSYFVKEAAPSPFVSGGIGVSSWGYSGSNDPWKGPGLLLGCGYEFRRHWYVEANIAVGKPKTTVLGEEWTTDVASVLVTFNVLGY